MSAAAARSPSDVDPLGPFVDDVELVRVLDDLVAVAATHGPGSTELAAAAEACRARVRACAPPNAAVDVLIGQGVVLVGPRVLRLPRAMRIQSMVLAELLRARGGDVLRVAADARPEDWLAFARRLTPLTRGAPRVHPVARVRLRPAMSTLVERVADVTSNAQATAPRAWAHIRPPKAPIASW